MTPEERKAAADAMRAEIEADRAQPRAKQDDPATKATKVKPSVTAPARDTFADSVNAQIDEQRNRAGGYLRSNQSTDHMN
jgi:hypothetical protein